MRRITCDDDVAEGLAALVALDPRLAAIAGPLEPLPLRIRGGGFAGLAAVVTGQQISDAAAAAIWARFEAAFDPMSPATVLAAADDAFRAAGQSRAKMKTLRAVAGAAQAGFDFDALAVLEAEAAVARLCALPGIGPWTAEVYLLFCTGHPDVFPAGDLALQVAAARALGLPGRPDSAQLRRIAADWTPWRGVAARLLWARYRHDRDAARKSGARTGAKTPALLIAGT